MTQLCTTCNVRGKWKTSHKHLESYLKEFTLRFNRRRSVSCEKLFYQLVQQTIHADTRTYRNFVNSPPVVVG